MRQRDQIQAGRLHASVPVLLEDLDQHAKSRCHVCRILREAVEIAGNVQQIPPARAKEAVTLTREYPYPPSNKDMIFVVKPSYRKFELCRSEGESAETSLEGNLGSAWKSIPIKRQLPTRLNSLSCYAQVWSWMTYCQQNHPDCSLTAPPCLPRRVVDVSQASAEAPLRLYESRPREEHEYLALSHCWGDPRTVPKTIGNTLVQHTKQIPEDEMSQTFKDAIEITRRLGYRYLWIDALCIIQDDDEDWAREAARMSEIYAEASFTISAVSSKDGAGGCFVERQSGRDYELSGLPAEWKGVFVRLPMEHGFGTKLVNAVRSLDPYPLAQRKWVFQERILSQRVVHYSRDELVWECNSGQACECSPVLGRVSQSEKSRLARLSHSRLGQGQEEAIGLWCELVNGYSTRSVTYAADTLPAFSAVARTFHRATKAWIGLYHAGLWEYGLPVLLCWESLRLMHKDANYFRHGRTATYCAPSWSWVSVQGPVTLPKPEVGPKPGMRQSWDSFLECDARVVSIDCTPARVGAADSGDPFGRISGGTLELEACGFDTSIVLVVEIWVRFNDWDCLQECTIDTDGDLDGIEGQDVCIVCIKKKRNTPFGAYRYLVLSRNGDGTFRRIGLACSVMEGNSSFVADIERSPRRVFRIV